MSDYTPDQMITFELKYGDSIQFYEQINHTEPKLIRGLFFVKAGESELPISLVILDPLQNVVYIKRKEDKGIISFDTTVAGEYTFIFANIQSYQDLDIIFSLNTY